jgi:hypothetical protein
MPIEPGSLADWAEALTNTVVLVFIYKQLRLMNVQMVQNDDQERFRRSWEFIKLYRDELSPTDGQLPPALLDLEVQDDLVLPDNELGQLVDLFYRPRLRLFSLLSQLLEHQEVEERLLFGYLIDDFNKFVFIGIRSGGAEPFKSDTAPKISMLLNAWGAQMKSRKLLFAN